MAESPSPKGALPYSLSTRVRICKKQVRAARWPRCLVIEDFHEFARLGQGNGFGLPCAETALGNDAVRRAPFLRRESRDLKPTISSAFSMCSTPGAKITLPSLTVSAFTWGPIKT